MAYRHTIADELVVRAARGTALTRRRFLRNAGCAAVSTSFVLAMGTRANASHVSGCGDLKADGRVCGPSPYCSSSRCYESGACHNSTRTKPRAYASNYCIGSGDGYVNCWCTAAFGNKYRCCDCCVDYNTGGNACQSNCGSGWYACICNGYICQNCY